MESGIAVRAPDRPCSLPVSLPRAPEHSDFSGRNPPASDCSFWTSLAARGTVVIQPRASLAAFGALAG